MSLIGKIKSVFENNNEETRENNIFVSAVIVAAGNSTRMGENKNKQLLMLSGKPVIAHTLMAFQEAESISEIVVVAREEDILDIADISSHFGISKLTNIIRGGSTRQQSVSAGLSVIKSESSYVAIHDGARPLITSAMIDNVAAEAIESGAAAAGVLSKDTLKLVDDDGYIVSTVDRSHIWSVQTPQVFELDIINKARLEADKEGVDYTDDCQLAEKIGVRVKMVNCGSDNIKITTPEDIAIAEGILSGRETDENWSRI